PMPVRLIFRDRQAFVQCRNWDDSITVEFRGLVNGIADADCNGVRLILMRENYGAKVSACLIADQWTRLAFLTNAVHRSQYVHICPSRHPRCQCTAARIFPISSKDSSGSA